MTDLFPEAKADSPKLAWLKKHGLVTEFIGMKGVESPETGDDLNNWICRVDKNDGSHWRTSEIGDGETEEEAIMDFCQNSGIRHWTLVGVLA